LGKAIVVSVLDDLCRLLAPLLRKRGDQFMDAENIFLVGPYVKRAPSRLASDPLEGLDRISVGVFRMDSLPVAERENAIRDADTLVP
jgi:hypothetical protein